MSFTSEFLRTCDYGIHHVQGERPGVADYAYIRMACPLPSGQFAKRATMRLWPGSVSGGKCHDQKLAQLSSLLE